MAEDPMARELFSVSGMPFRWGDVVGSMRVTGAWEGFEERVRRGVAALAAAEPEAGAVDAVANVFRYERNLLAADDLEAWLERRGLDLADWMGFVRRRVARLARPETPPSGDEVATLLWAEGICSGEFQQHASELARRLSLAESADAGSSPGPDGGPAALARAWQVAEDTLEALCTPEAIAEETGRRTLDWLRVDGTMATFLDEEAALEAIQLVTTDGLDLAAATAEAGVEAERLSVHLEDADPDLRTVLLAAEAGALTQPLRRDQGLLLIHVLDRVEPSPQDPEIAARAREAIRSRALERAESRRVRWHDVL